MKKEPLYFPPGLLQNVFLLTKTETGRVISFMQHKYDPQKESSAEERFQASAGESLKIVGIILAAILTPFLVCIVSFLLSGPHHFE